MTHDEKAVGKCCLHRWNNVYKVKDNLGWKVDTRKLRRYLEEHYGVYKAYYCIGFLEANRGLYRRLESEDYVMVYKKTSLVNGEIKGNIDAELVLKAMTQYRVYEKAVIITSDGDFACLVDYLVKKDKLSGVIASKRTKCSHLLEEASGSYIAYIDELRGRLEYLD